MQRLGEDVSLVSDAHALETLDWTEGAWSVMALELVVAAVSEAI